MISPINLRHWMQQNPELSLQEFRITELLEQEIRNISTRLGILRPLPTGLIVVYPGETPDYILVRADIDALPMQGYVKHACGHDLHTAILYGTIQEVVSQNIQQSCIFLFQPGEETGGGAKQILDSHVLDSFPISKALSLHVTDDFPFGSVAVKPGPLFSASCEFDIQLQGKESHITRPEQGINALDALMRILPWLQTKQDDSIFVGVGRIEAGTVRNVTPSSAILQGTIRAGTANRIDQFLVELQQFLVDEREANQVEFCVSLGTRYPEVIVDPELLDEFVESLNPKIPVIPCFLKLTAEDFGFFTSVYPSLMFWLGTGTIGKSVGLHHPDFYPDDSIIEVGIQIWMNLLSKNCC